MMIKMDKNTYIIKKYPDNKTGYSRSIVYDKQHFMSYLQEMKTGEVVKLKNHKYEIEIEKVDVDSHKPV